MFPSLLCCDNMLLNDIIDLLYLWRYAECHYETSVTPHMETVDLTGEPYGSAEPCVVDEGKQVVER